ncbi:MAG: hypothetical protein FJ297_16155 [Planctomycetes bacterium]|nr:hypothetical protein [Planctomycetota bacterium]
MDRNTELFSLGRLLATPGAMEALEASGEFAGEFVARHARGDWGEMGAEDARSNDRAVDDGSRVFSAYTTRLGARLWVITESADESGRRAATTILLPDEY